MDECLNCKTLNNRIAYEKTQKERYEKEYATLRKKYSELVDSFKKLKAENDGLRTGNKVKVHIKNDAQMKAEFLQNQLKIANDAKERLEQELSNQTKSYSELEKNCYQLHVDFAAKLDEQKELQSTPTKAQEACSKSELRNERRASKYCKTALSSVRKDLRKLQKEISPSPEKNYSDLVNRTSRKNRCLEGIEALKKISGTKHLKDYMIDLMKLLSSDEDNDFNFRLTAETSLKISTRLGLTKNVQRQLKQFIRRDMGWDIFLPRNKMDQIEEEFARNDLFEVSSVTVEDKKGKPKQVYISQISNLKETLSTRLKHLAKSGNLTFDGSTKDSIWFAIFGDKGKDVTKLVGVIGNTRNPNSCFHLMPLGLYDGDDTGENLKKYLPNVIQQLNELDSIEYEVDGKIEKRPVVQFLGGDMKFLSSCLGHRGQAARHCCPQCNFVKTGMKMKDYNHRKKYTMRTIDQYEQDRVNGDYSVDKEGCLVFEFFFSKLEEILRRKLEHLNKWREDYQILEKVFKSLHNCCERSIEPPAVPIPICSAEYCIYQDRVINASQAVPKFDCCTCSNSFHLLCGGVWTVDDRILLDESDEGFVCFRCTETPPTRTKELVRIKIEDVKQEVERLVEDYEETRKETEKLRTIAKGRGLTRQKLEECWSSVGADISAFFQSFTGNQIKTLLTDHAIDKYMAMFPETEELNALRIFLGAFAELQSLCTTEVLDDDDIATMETVLEVMMDSLKKAQPNATVIPKLHVLMSHVLPFVKSNRTWAKTSEQGIEAYHAFYNRILRQCECIRNPELRVRRIFKLLLLHNVSSDSS